MNKFRKPHGEGRFGDRGQREFGRPDFQRGGGFRRETKMFDAVCSKCGKPCQVPFRPNGMKPVFCNECFSGQNRTSEPRAEGFARIAPPVYAPQSHADEKAISELKRQMDVMNSKLDNILRLVQTPATIMAEVVPAAKAKPDKATKKAIAKKAIAKKKAKK